MPERVNPGMIGSSRRHGSSVALRVLLRGLKGRSHHQLGAFLSVLLLQLSWALVWWFCCVLSFEGLEQVQSCAWPGRSVPGLGTGLNRRENRSLHSLRPAALPRSTSLMTPQSTR